MSTGVCGSILHRCGTTAGISPGVVATAHVKLDRLAASPLIGGTGKRHHSTPGHSCAREFPDASNHSLGLYLVYWNTQKITVSQISNLGHLSTEGENGALVEQRSPRVP